MIYGLQHFGIVCYPGLLLTAGGDLDTFHWALFIGDFTSGTSHWAFSFGLFYWPLFIGLFFRAFSMGNLQWALGTFYQELFIEHYLYIIFIWHFSLSTFHQVFLFGKILLANCHWTLLVGQFLLTTFYLPFFISNLFI